MTMASDPVHNQHVASDANPSSTIAAMDQVPLDTNTPQPVRHWTEGDALNTSSESTRRFSQRLSFFGRSSSDAAKPPTPNPAMTTPNNRGIDALIDQQRPSTAQSESKRRTTDHFENIRNSIFGSRKLASANGQANPPALRPSSRDSQRSKVSRKSQSLDRPRINSSLLSFTAQGESKTPGKEGQFNSAKEYYRHHKKSSISPPFNFQHITHIAKKHLPKLETVDEKDLAAKFWAVNAYQKPKQQLSGIKAEQLEKPREGSLSPDRPRSFRRVTQASVSSSSEASRTATHSVDETIFDETHETKFNPDDVYRSLEDIHDPKLSNPSTRSSPKHYSSTSALSSLSSQSRYRQVKGQASFDESSIARSPPRPLVPPRARTSLPVESTENRRALNQSFYDKQLPAIPQEEAVQKDSKVSRDSSSSASYSLFPAPPSQTAGSNALAARPKPISVATLGSQQAEVLNETTWEDDIDFAYEQEAEAMCDFDWESAQPLQPDISEGDHSVPSAQPSPCESSGASSPNGGVRLSASIYQPSAFTSATSISNRERSSSTATSNFSSTEHVNGHHRRGSSVGHKGFQAARKTTGDGVAKTSPSLPLEFVPEVSTATPPPTFSLTDADVETTKKLPNEPAYFPTMETLMPGYLSDPESAQTDGSRHRKSSSYGSYQSSERSLLLGSDTTRWSSTSSSSLPDLLHGKRKSRSSVAKRRHSRPLDSVPQSPTFDEDVSGEDNLTVPARNSLWDKEQLDPSFMRRPSSPGDRQVLYSAGRFVQRGRSATPSRLPQRSTAENVEPGWI